MRSVSHQMHTAKFPVHRDLAGFDFEVSPVDRKLVLQLAETTRNATIVFVVCDRGDRYLSTGVFPA